MSRRALLHALTVRAADRWMPEPHRPGASAPSAGPPPHPSILLVTLDTTRADAIGPEATGVETPAFNALAARGAALPPGLRHRAGNAAVAQLDHDRPLSRRPRRPRERAALPADVPIARGAAAAGRLSHRRVRLVVRARAAVRPRARVRRLRRRLCRRRPVADATRVAVRAIVGRRRDARLAELDRPRDQPRFLWVHYYDPHAPYTPPEPFRSRYAQESLSRRGRGDGRAARPARPGLRATRQARRRSSSSPITAKGSAITARRSTAICSTSRRCTCRWCWSARASRRASSDAPVSTRRIFHTILDWAGLGIGTHASSAGHSVDRDRARRGDEAVSRVRLAAAGDGGDRRRQGDPGRERSRPTISRRIRAKRTTSAPARNCPRAAAQGAGRLSGAVARRGAGARRISTRRRGSGSRASATSAPARRRSCARTRRGRPT